MIHGLVRCPSGYFDVTPTGRLINKFSNDLGILDNTLAFVFIDMIEGPIVTLIMIANIFQINVFFIPPGAINIIFLAIFFLYCKNVIV
jgi:ABC-type multidrug transport system fused ATPase/permease subunit